MRAIASQITGVSNDCSTDVQAQIKENIKAPHHWLCEGNPPVTDGFPSQRASATGNVSIWWRYNVFVKYLVGWNENSILFAAALPRNQIISTMLPQSCPETTP